MKEFSPQSKVWIYQSDRTLTESEIASIRKNAARFIENWTAHGKLLTANIEIFYNLFLVLMVDETYSEASGCGIDKSVHFFQQVEKELNINLFNRLVVAYKSSAGVQTCSLASFQNKIKNKEVTEDTLVFNNLVTTKKEFDSNWEIKLKDSWHSKLRV